MLLRDSADILVPSQSQDEKGRMISVYSVNRTIDCDLQTYKYSVVYSPAGVTDKASNLMFCKDTGINPLNRIRHNGILYRIDCIIPFRNHVEVYLEKVI